MMSRPSALRPVLAALLCTGVIVHCAAQEWNCIQVQNDGTVSLNWEVDALGAEFYSVTPMLPPPDYTPLPSTDIDMEPDNVLSNLVGSGIPLLTTTQELCYTLTALDALGNPLADPSDTLCSIHLELEAGVVPGTVDLA